MNSLELLHPIKLHFWNGLKGLFSTPRLKLDHPTQSRTSPRPLTRARSHVSIIFERGGGAGPAQSPILEGAHRKYNSCQQFKRYTHVTHKNKGGLFEREG